MRQIQWLLTVYSFRTFHYTQISLKSQHLCVEANNVKHFSSHEIELVFRLLISSSINFLSCFSAIVNSAVIELSLITLEREVLGTVEYATVLQSDALSVLPALSLSDPLHLNGMYDH